MELGYDQTASVASGNTFQNPAFNGNIGGTVWKSKGDGINRKYDLSYDNANRLTGAAFLQNSTASTWDNSFVDFSVSGLSYDANGNINTMNQNGFVQAGSKPIDQLTYNYVNGNGNSNRLSYVNDGANVTNSTLGDFHFTGSSKTPSSVDYTYDADANTISDNNRSITGITYYNYPNLPQTITTGKGTIQYFYDAAGNKLKKQVTENNIVISSIVVNNTTLTNVTTNIVTTTTYVNGLVYKSMAYTNPALAPLNTNNTDVLQFISDEEGRIRFKPISGTIAASFVHDYFIRDHLGNVRVGITDESQQDIYPAATGETASKPVNGVTNTPQNYEALFYNFTPRDFVSTATLPWYSSLTGGTILNENDNGMPANNDPFSSTGSYSAEVFQLCGNTANNLTGDNFGLGITLKVMAGDQVSIYGSSFWHNTGLSSSSGYPVSAVLNSLLGVFGSSSAVTSTTGREVLDGSTFNTTTSPTASLLSPLLNNSYTQSGGQAPYAGINYIVFDDQFRPVSVGFDPVSGTPDNIKNHAPSLTFPAVTIPKNGYIYVYVSNQSNINVYFDNLQVTQTRGPILEEMHYYPVGLAMAGISDRAWNKGPNYFHYQGKEMQDQEWNDGSGLEEYDFDARFYDPQLGRWNTQDPAGQYASPYLGMGNNWMSGTDPDGMSFWSTLADIGAFIGTGGIGYIGASLESTGRMFSDVSDWNHNWYKGAITADLIAGSAFVGEEAIFSPEILTASLGSTGASIATGAAQGVLQGVLTNEISSVQKTGNLSWNWDQMFVSTVSGAITGTLSAKPVSNDIDKTIFGNILPQNSIFKGLASNVIGSVMTTGFKEADSKGWSWGHFFDVSTQWPAESGKIVGQGVSWGINQLHISTMFGDVNAQSSLEKTISTAFLKDVKTLSSQLQTNLLNGSKAPLGNYLGAFDISSILKNWISITTFTSFYNAIFTNSTSDH
jgi:RHS repeat-associated protein